MKHNQRNKNFSNYDHVEQFLPVFHCSGGHEQSKNLAMKQSPPNQTFLFSVHISYGKLKYLNQTGFLIETTKFISNLKGFTQRIQLT